MSFKRKMLGAAVAVALGSVGMAAQAATLPIGSMTITGGTFFMAGVTPAPTPFTTIGPNTNLVGGYINGIVGFPFFGSPVTSYTAAANLGSANTPAGSIAGGPVPTGTVDDVAGTISMNLSSFFANWNGTDFNQGANPATGTWNPVTEAYSLTSSKLIVGGPFDGFTGTWVFNGTAAVVPLPAGVWLLGVGLAGVLGLARRRGEDEVVEA